MEIEINFRLDKNGGTARRQQLHTNPQNDIDSDENDCSLGAVDYSYRIAMTNLKPSSSYNDDGDISKGEQQERHQQRMDDLLFDRENSDSGLMPRTFWVPAQGFTPRCSLEQFAIDVYNNHVPKELKYDLSTRAEWWFQLRPSSEKTGHAMHRRR
jgi:hypothetical protein